MHVARHITVGCECVPALDGTRCATPQGTFKTAHHMGIVLEYLDGGDLSELVDRRWADGGAGISESDARRMFQQLLVAVDYCHGMGIANRDIKVQHTHSRTAGWFRSTSSAPLRPALEIM